MVSKRLSFRLKMFLGFGVLIGLMILNILVTLYAMATIDQSKHTMVHLNHLDKQLLQKITDHYVWVTNAYKDILDPGKSRLGVEMDDHKCRLGSWLYGAERKDAESLFPGLQGTLKAMEQNHEALHDSAAAINTVMAKRQGMAQDVFIRDVTRILSQQTYPALKDVENGLLDASGLIKDKVEYYDTEMENTHGSIRMKMISLSALIIFIAVAFGLALSRYMMKSMRSLTAFSEKLSDGDFTAEVSLENSDEFGDLADAMKGMADKLGRMVDAVVSEIVALSSSSNDLYGISNQLAQGAEQMSERSLTVAAATEEMSSNMNTVAAASEESSTSIGMVAAATEEMSSTVETVAGNLEKARSISSQAVSKAHDASERVKDLGNAAEDISKVTEVITEISEQTNLLALNATIEAARAGESGKGFAVVANEIKELARQTAQATQDIKDKVLGIQGSTSSTSAEIGEISKVINDVDDIVGQVAASVSEQADATREIASNVAQASVGLQEVTVNVAQCSAVSDEVARDMAQVSSISQTVDTGSRTVSGNAGELADFASKIKTMITAFKIPDYESDGDGARMVDGGHIQPLVTFDDSIRLGIPDIDQQHSHLVDLINRLHKSMKLRKSKAEAGAVLDELVNYTVTHFAHEESRMRECGYDGLTGHIEKHKDLINQVGSFREQFSQGQATLTMDLMEFLKDWLINHIKGVDRKYAPALKKNA